jgi:type II secretory pathway pseudopilin PulG
MSERNPRGERGYALIEAMVGGAVLMIALGSVLGGLVQASGYVARAEADQKLTQFLVDQSERLRALSVLHPYWDTVGLGKACLDVGVRLPSTWTCKIDVYKDTDSAMGGAAGPVEYRRAVVTVTSRTTSQSLAVLKW